jgi:hypothetical protein
MVSTIRNSVSVAAVAPLLCVSPDLARAGVLNMRSKRLMQGENRRHSLLRTPGSTSRSRSKLPVVHDILLLESRLTMREIQQKRCDFVAGWFLPLMR